MRLSRIHLQNFRNLGSVKLNFSSDRIFFIGKNGQGKSNLLESIGMLSTLRSFRGASSESMVKQEAQEASLFAQFLDDHGNERDVLISFGRKGAKSVILDGEPVKKLGELLGEFPSVCLSSRDFRLIRESPSDRRRWMDLVLSSSSSTYLYALQGYYRSMKERNVLLKKQAGDSEILAFEQRLASSAHTLFQMRCSLFPELDQAFEHAYSVLSHNLEVAQLRYLPESQAQTRDQWLEIFAKERTKDRLFGSTRKGPHRDDFSLLLNDQDACDFGSEGQQKGLVLALRMAEFSFLKQKLGRTPLLLADDFLGELDSSRRSNFRKLLPPTAQTFATGTEFPSKQDAAIWEAFEVDSGSFSPFELTNQR